MARLDATVSSNLVHRRDWSSRIFNFPSNISHSITFAVREIFWMIQFNTQVAGVLVVCNLLIIYFLKQFLTFSSPCQSFSF